MWPITIRNFYTGNATGFIDERNLFEWLELTLSISAEMYSIDEFDERYPIGRRIMAEVWRMCHQGGRDERLCVEGERERDRERERESERERERKREEGGRGRESESERARRRTKETDRERKGDGEKITSSQITGSLSAETP